MSRRYLQIGESLSLVVTGYDADDHEVSTPEPAWRLVPDDGTVVIAVAFVFDAFHLTITGAVAGRCVVTAYTNVLVDAGTGATALIETESWDIEVRPDAATPGDATKLVIAEVAP